MRYAESRLFVEMFGGENETLKSSDGEGEKIRPVEVGWRGGRQGSEGDEMSDGSSGSPESEVEEGCDPPFEDVDVDCVKGRPERVGDRRKKDFGKVDDEGDRNSQDSHENLEDCGWQVGPLGRNEALPAPLATTTTNATATTTDTSTATLGAPVGFALGRAQPIRRPGAVAWLCEQPCNEYCGRRPGSPMAPKASPSAGYENLR